jgi:hypothetical protein
MIFLVSKPRYLRGGVVGVVELAGGAGHSVGEQFRVSKVPAVTNGGERCEEVKGASGCIAPIVKFSPCLAPAPVTCQPAQSLDVCVGHVPLPRQARAFHCQCIQPSAVSVSIQGPGLTSGFVMGRV